MAKIQVAGNAVVFSSSMKLKDLEMIAKYDPQALMLKNDDEEIVFMCNVLPGVVGDVANEYVVFGMESMDDSKVATVTKMLGGTFETQEKLKELLADKMGAALNAMNKLEEALPAALEKVKADREAVMGAIEIA